MDDMNKEYGLEDLSLQEREFFQKLPLIPPKRAFKLLEKHGYRGQILARRSLSLAAYRHVKRLKQIYLEKISRDHLPPKMNLLLVGPTGCGKTFLIELLFKHILKLPTVIIDVTGFSETGYIGEDTKTILTRLLLAANGSPLLASAGVVCLDEFDKLATNQNTVKSDGQGGTKDVSGYGVQRELLKILEPSYMEIPTDFDNSLYSTKQKLFTGDITFLASGAFSHLKSTVEARNAVPTIGFGNATKEEKKQVAYMLSEDEINDIANFHQYGFIPELMGRFTRMVSLFPLDHQTLKSILIDNVVSKFQREFSSEGLQLDIDEKVLDYIVEKSYERQTGARGLGALLTQYLENTAFEHFCESKGKIFIKLRKNKITTIHRSSHKKTSTA